MDVNKEMKFLCKFKKKFYFFFWGGGGRGSVGGVRLGGGRGVRVDVNEELKFL